MDSSIIRYLVAFVIFMAFIVLLFFGVTAIFGGNDKPNPPTTSNPPTPAAKTLPQYADTYAEVSMTVDGPINGDDAHRAIRIIVDRFQRRITILTGYNYNVIEEHKIPNNQTAYDIFLRALNNSGFMAKRTDAKVTDERGQCPLGTRTIFELNNSGDIISHLWTSSCGASTGTLGVGPSTLQSLFQAQITDYNKIISNSKVVL